MLRVLSLLATASAFRIGNIEEVNFNCVGLADGVKYVNPDECTEFFTCTNGIAKNFTCADEEDGADLHFNIETRTCDWKANAKCDASSRIAGFQDCKGRNEDLKHPAFDSQKYFTCSGGAATLESCNGSDVFDAFKRRCVASNADDVTTWITLAADGKKVNTFLAQYANAEGKNVTFVGSSTYEQLYAHTAKDLKNIEEGNDLLPVTEPPVVAPQYELQSLNLGSGHHWLFARDVTAKNCLKITTTVNKEAHVHLKATGGDMVIGVGGWNNSASGVWKGMQDQEVHKQNNTPLSSAGEERTFYVDWQYNNIYLYDDGQWDMEYNINLSDYFGTITEINVSASHGAEGWWSFADC